MTEIMKKTLIILAAGFLLVVLLYVAFYLFLAVVVVAIGVVLYRQWKTEVFPFFRRIFSRDKAKDPSPPAPLKRKVVDVEYVEIHRDDRP